MGVPYKDVDTRNNDGGNSGQPKFIIDTLSASPHNSVNEFNFQLQSGKLKFVNLHAKLSGSYPLDKFLVPNTWKTRFSMDNSTTLTILRPIVITRLEDDVVFIPETAENLEYEIEFEHITTTPATSSAFLTSYADVTFGNLRTFSGDVSKVKLFGRQQDKQNAEFEKFGEFALETKNELKDSTSVTGNDPIGVFYSQSVVDNFWETSSAQPIQISNTQIMNSVLVSGSNYADGNYVEFKTKNQFELEKNEEYIVSFQSYFIKKDKQQADGSVRKSAEIEVFLSGSVISQTGETLSLGSVSDFGDNASELLKGNVSGSIPRLYNYFTTHKKSGVKPKAGLVFRVNAGEFYISNVRLEPVSDRNFNPGFYKTIVPMPIGSRRGQRYDFVSEFYDSNNNKADFEAVTSASVLFAGAPQVLADGTDAVLSGSVQIGDSMEMYGVNPAYLRSIGYQGFDKTIAGTGDRNGGFMLWSGSIGSTIGASETYNGVGLEVVDASSTNKHEHAFLQFASNYKGTGNPRFRVQTDEFLLGVSGSGAAETFISGSQGKLRISSSNFHLDDDGAVTMQGTITATAGGTIGGFTIGSNTLSATNFILDTSLQSIVLGSSDNILIASASQGLSLGARTFSAAPFRVTPAGNLIATNITATGGTVGGLHLGSTSLHAGDNGIGSVNTKLAFRDITNGGVPKFSLGTSANAMTLIQGDGVYMDGGGDFRVGEAKGHRIEFDQSAGTLIMSSSKFMLGSKGSSNSYISSSGNLLEISSSNFRLSSSGDVCVEGTITATAGTIGGFTIGSSTLTGTNFTIDTSDKSITLGSGDDVFIADADGGIQLGDATFADAPFSVTPAGVLKAQSGTIGGFTIDADEIKSTNLLLDSSNEKITLGSANAITLQGGGTDNFMAMGGKSTFGQTGTAGIIIGMDATVPKLDLTKGTGNDNYLRFDGSSGIDIKTPSFKLDTDRLDIDSSTSRISVFDDAGSPKEVVRIGEVDGLTNYGMKIFDGTGTADSDILVEFSETENTIAGWDISTSTISKNNIVIDSSGFISSQGYASNVQGFFLGARALSDGSVGSFLEVDEANIRGTLKTTVFEKESVNAVGGQLQIANSTTITGSVSMSATATTMSVANASGFAAGEIILAKKFNATGFSTEYMRVNSASRQDITSDVNFSGSLMVTRALGQSAPQGTVSSSIGFSGSVGQEYTPGQVIVSTGKIGTGYIRLNANPNDQTTPYMDIVERTGSGVYDINLKARLGDLSGVVDTINGQSVSGFGLYTDNAFLKGGIVASYGSIGGFNMSSTDLWAGNATLGNAGTVMVLGDTNTSTPKIALGGQANNITATSGTGIYMDGSSNAKFRVGNPSGQNIYWNGSTLSVAGSITISNPGDIDISDLNNDSGFTDDSTANAATASAATAQSTANAATGSAAAAQATANAATGSAATAQAAIDLMETRVVIDNTGMALKAKNDAGSGTLNGQTIAEYGTTTTFFDGVASADANKKLELNASGITLFGSQAGNDYLFLEAGGIEMRSNNVRTLHITDHGINIGPSATGPGSANTPSAVAGNISLHGQGARIYGEATNDYVDVKANGVDVVTAGSTVAQFAATTIIGSSTDKVSISDSGITIRENNKDVISMASDVVTIGSSTDQVEINGTSGITIRENNADTISMVNGVVTVGSSTDKVTINGTSGITIRENNADTISMVNGVVTIGSSTDQVEINGTSGITIRENNVDTIALSGGSVVVGEVGASKSNVQITSGAINLRNNTTNKLVLAADGSITIGSNVSITSGGNVTLSGNITATAGNIGGWNIDGNTLKSDDNSIVLDEGNDIIKVVGTAAGIGGSSLATSAELFNDGATSGSSFRILKDGMDGSTDVEIVKINSSQQYKTGDIDTDYTTNVDKKSIAFTNSGTGDSDITTTFAAGDTSWPDNGIIGYLGAKGTGATNGLVCQMAENTGSFNLLDTQEDNNVVEITFQNLRESVVDSGTTGTKKSRYQWKAEIYQSDTNSASPSTAELVGSFKISSLLTDTTSNSAVTTPDLYVLNKRYFFVSFKGWGYDELTDDTDGKKFELDFNGAPISATQYLPKTRMTALGLQSYAGPNQNAMFGAKNEIIGDFITRKTSADTRGNIQVEGKASIGTIEIDDTFTLYTEGEIGASGNITAFYSSDKRLKENIVEIKDGLSIVNQLRPVKFDWKEDSPFAHLKPTEYGLIAQEVEEVIPEVVGRMKQDYKGVKYEGLVPLLIQSIKDLTKRVEELEKKVN